MRNAQGQPLANALVNFQFQIQQGTSGGSVVFTETDTALTNQFGLATVQIGSSVSLASVSWGTGNQYLQVGIDITGGTNFVNMGTSQLLSVPYALYSGNGGGSGWGLTGNTGTTYGTDFIGTTNNQGLMFRINDSVGGRIEVANENTSLGYQALNSNTGVQNVAIGAYALNSNKGMSRQVAIGDSALFNFTGSGSNGGNTAIGTRALLNTTTGYRNTASGYNSLYSNTTGIENTANGHQALFSNTTGNTNTATGKDALEQNTTGYSNVAMGIAALYSNTTLSHQLAIGDSALYNGGGGENTALGSKTLFSSGAAAAANTAVGFQALYANTTGNYNTANGSWALNYNTSGSYNTANGVLALPLNTTGTNNTANGFEVLYSNTTGSFNTANGDGALYSDTSGSSNTANGEQALYGNTTGSDNTANGIVALYHNTTGSNNTALGYAADVSTGNLTNATAIGNGALVDATDKVVIGNTSVSSIGGQVGWTNYSDERVKTNVEPNVPGLTFIKLLQPVTYNYDINKENELLGVKNDSKEYAGKHDIESITFSGFIAQHVDVAAKSAGYDFSGVDKHGSIWGLRYSEFVPAIVKSVQELDNKIEQGDAKQQSIILKLQQQIEAMQREIEELKKK